MSTRKIAWVADMHTGSEVGLWDTYVTDEGVEIRGSDANKRLLEYWHQWWEWAEEIGYDTVVLLGDLQDGNNPRERGRSLTVVEIERQVDVAVTLLEPWVTGKVVHGVSGSDYHNSLDAKLDRLALKQLKGASKTRWHGEMANMELTGTGQVVHFTHGSGAGTLYRTTAMNAQMCAIAEGLGNGKLTKNIDLVVKGHLHEYDLVENAHRGALQVPGWKLLFPWKPILKRYPKNLPDIGGCVVEFDQQGYRVYRKIFPHLAYYDKMKRG
jgi:hypothetical protein